MKPITLTICGWGPYRDEQPPIDFEALGSRGLFLITGATGAGKTTIFDAVTYALYGDLSGKTREKGSVRSDFAAPSTKTYVELVMEHGGKRYRIRRNPEYMRPRKRQSKNGELTKEKENAYLTMPDGSCIEGSSEVTARIRELLKVDINQFRQLSMIAQGEFTRLLTAPSSEKSKIFREIFDTKLYERLEAKLKNSSAELYRQVMEYRHRMEEEVSVFSPDEELKAEVEALVAEAGIYSERLLPFLKEKISVFLSEEKRLHSEEKKAEEEIEELAGIVKEAEQTKALMEQLAKEREKQKSLAEREPDYRQMEERLQRAEEAAAVREYELLLQNREEQRKTCEKKLQLSERELEGLLQKQEEQRTLVELAEQIAEAFDMKERCEEAERLRQEKETALREKKQEFGALQVRYEKAEKEAEASIHDYENAERRYRHGIAGILAQDLKEGEPCPVCGALSHPCRQEREQGVPTEEELKEKKLLSEKKRQELLKIHGETRACREARDLLDREAEKSRRMQQELTEKMQELPAEIREYPDFHKRSDFEKQRKEAEEICLRISEKKKTKAALRQERQVLLEKEGLARGNFRDELQKAGFTGEEEYRAAFLPEQKRKEEQEAVKDYGQRCHAKEHLIHHLEEELKVREQRSPAEEQQKLAEIRKKKDSLTEAGSRLWKNRNETEKLYRSLKEKKEKSTALSEKYGIIKDLDDAVNGNNKKRLVLEQYVLAAYFEEILKAANLRLAMMSGGRYTLYRTKEVTDGRSKDSLDMEVLDYYTGRYRSVKTLSGGETFKVSLSLALGMSDVVQAYSGGIQVDALFIDEGFGSLDQESLEQACQTLMSLAESDRMIGIISHVPLLSEKIENQIQVKKTSTGSTYQLVVF